MKPGNAIGCLISFVFGGIFAVAGVFIMMLALDLIHVDSSQIEAPHWMMAAFGLLFVLAGTKVFSMGAMPVEAMQTPFFQWTQSLLMFGILLLFGGMFIWTAFQPDEGAALTDRLIFGGAGLLIAGWAIFSAGKRILQQFRAGHNDEEK